jgi:hypothetical protein
VIYGILAPAQLVGEVFTLFSQLCVKPRNIRSFVMCFPVDVQNVPRILRDASGSVLNSPASGEHATNSAVHDASRGSLARVVRRDPQGHSGAGAERDD